MLETPFLLSNRPYMLTNSGLLLKGLRVKARIIMRLKDSGASAMKIDYGDAVSDVLTTVLNALQFKGKVFCYSKFTAPWAVRMRRKEYAHFHFFERGQGWIELEETGAQTSVMSGDLVILPRGGAHILKDDRKTKAVNIDSILDHHEDHILRYGGGGLESSTVCGAFAF
jgi:mannose-6-phosphate isomerase-like protein (cupin superfamily)